MKAKALSIIRYQDDINTEHNMKSYAARQGLTGQSAWLAMDIRGFKTGKAQIFIYYTNEINWKLKITAVLSERVRGSIHRSESGRVRNLATTPPRLAVVFSILFDIYKKLILLFTTIVYSYSIKL